MSSRLRSVHTFSESLQASLSSRRFSLLHLTRLFFVAFLLATFAFSGGNSILVPAAFAATRLITGEAAHSSQPIRVTNAPLAPGAAQTHPLLAKPNTATPQAPYDKGLGILPFYTFVHHPLNVCACGKKEISVNVANGNLILQSVELQVHGTGEDLVLDAYYNSITGSNAYQEFGQNWNMSLGRDIYLDESHVSTALVLYGTSNSDAYFAHNGDGTFTSPPGINATIVDNGNGTYTLTYHSNGQQWLFGSNGSLASITDKNGNKISLSYSGATTSSITDTQGRVVTFGHNGAGRISQVADSTGRSTSYTYDGSNNLTSSTDLASNVTKYAYTSGNLTTITDARNNATTMTYDSSQRVTSITDPLGGVTTFTYNSGNTVVTDANGHATTYTYDSNFKVTSTKDALGHTSSTAFDATNYNVISTTDALSNKNTFTFAPTTNNLTTVTDGNGNSSSATYNNSSFPYYPDTSMDEQGNKVSYAYDAVGNVASVTNSLASQNNANYHYNHNGTLGAIIDANGHETKYGYDSQGNLTSVTPPTPLGSESLTYDASSRITSTVDGNTNTTSFIYDNLDRITQITYSNGTTKILYTYDADGNQTSITDSTGTTNFVYDALNRMTKKTLPDGTLLTYSYDKVGNLTSYTDAGGTVTYGYNVVNLLTSLTEPSGAKTTYGYDNANRRTSMTLPSSTSIVVSYSYDNAGHTLSVKAVKGSTTLLNFSYVYKGSLKTSATDLTGNVTSYSYDALNRLTDALTKTSGGTQKSDYSYAYDGVGNRTSATANGVTTTYSYNFDNELLKSTQGNVITNYTYDGNGNETTGNGRTFTINLKNQTTEIDTTNPTSYNNYVYSGTNQTDRVEAKGVVDVFSALGLSIEGEGSSTPTYYTRSNAGQLVNERTTSGTYYYLTDDLGSVVDLVDSNGAVKNSYSYDPYGNSISKSEAVTNPWQYASGYLDANTGLYKFGARYYDSALGRWTQLDSQGGGYVYANDVPNMLVDPTGKAPGNCGDAELYVTPGALGGTATFELTLVSFLGDIQSFLSVLTIYDQSELFPFPTQLVLPSTPDSIDGNFGSLTLPNYETGSGEVTAAVEGIAVLTDGTLCDFGAGFTGPIP